MESLIALSFVNAVVTVCMTIYTPIFLRTLDTVQRSSQTRIVRELSNGQSIVVYGMTQQRKFYFPFGDIILSSGFKRRDLNYIIVADDFFESPPYLHGHKPQVFLVACEISRLYRNHTHIVMGFVFTCEMMTAFVSVDPFVFLLVGFLSIFLITYVLDADADLNAASRISDEDITDAIGFLQTDSELRPRFWTTQGIPTLIGPYLSHDKKIRLLRDSLERRYTGVIDYCLSCIIHRRTQETVRINTRVPVYTVIQSEVV
jgi:hypothetical protein